MSIRCSTVKKFQREYYLFYNTELFEKTFFYHRYKSTEIVLMFFNNFLYCIIATDVRAYYYYFKFTSISFAAGSHNLFEDIEIV